MIFILDVNQSFICGEAKLFQNVAKFQNIMSMIPDYSTTEILIQHKSQTLKNIWIHVFICF